jgi:hypothetical protein
VKKYVKENSKDGRWAGEFEILAISKLYPGIQILVYRLVEPS